MTVATLEHWQEVPQRVVALYAEAAPLVPQIREAVGKLPCAPRAGQVFWHPKEKTAWAVIGAQGVPAVWTAALQTVPGVVKAAATCDAHPPADQWVLVKGAAWTAADLSPLRNLGRLHGGVVSPTVGGPNALATLLVGGLLTGGLGYGAGALAEHLFPKRFVRRGRLRKALGAVGLTVGSIPGLYQYMANAANLRASGEHGRLAPLFTPTEDIPLSPAKQTWQREQQRRFPAPAIKANERVASTLTWPNTLYERACRGYVKLAYGPGTQLSAGGTGLRAVPVDAFNAAIWNDVRLGMSPRRNPYGTKSPWGDNSQELHTPPQHGAAATGLVSGIQTMYGGKSVLSPQHFIKGLATAGVDLATAHVAGGVLGALGGMTPEAQGKLQTMGLWGGFIRGVVGSIFGR